MRESTAVSALRIEITFSTSIAEETLIAKQMIQFGSVCHPVERQIHFVKGIACNHH